MSKMTEMANKLNKLTEKDQTLLAKQLKVYSKRAKVGESGRIAKDNKGFKLRKGRHFDNITEGQSPTVANISTGIYERLINSITRNKPSPQIAAKNSTNVEGAMLLQAGVLQIWDNINMTQNIKVAALLAGFCRPAFHYVFFNRKLRGGIGDIDSRVIPPYRCIVDNRFRDVKHMEYVGFWEEMTRKELIELFPSKADDIEEASEANTSALNNSSAKNPYQDDNGSASDFEPALTRLSPTFTEGTGTYSINTGSQSAKKEAAAEKVRIEFLWIDDASTLEKQRQKVDGLGRPVMMFVRDERGEIIFEEKQNEIVQGPFGPLNFPQVEPRLEPVNETIVENKYKYRRHVAWLPEDDIILWDVAWDGPIPCISQRDNYAMDGYWTEGLVHRLIPYQNAYNITLSMIQEKQRNNLNGSWFATPGSGLKTNKLNNRSGSIYQAFKITEADIRQIKSDPMDPIFPQMLDKLESMMMKQLGISNIMQGEAAGRVDSADVYDKLLENASGAIVDIAQMLEQTILELTEVFVWLMQTYYTHEHIVEIDANVQGETEWRPAAALLTQGEYSVKLAAGSMIYQTEAQQFARYAQYATMGFYPLPLLGKLAKVPYYKEGLQQKGELLQDPSKAYLLGPSAGTPAKLNSATQGITKRSHHAPGSGK